MRIGTLEASQHRPQPLERTVLPLASAINAEAIAATRGRHRLEPVAVPTFQRSELRAALTDPHGQLVTASSRKQVNQVRLRSIFNIETARSCVSIK
jgi:hypothetical protein